MFPRLGHKTGLWTLLIIACVSITLNSQTIPMEPRESATQLKQRAETLIRKGHIDEAVDLYLELLHRNPHNQSIYFRLSGLMKGPGDTEVLLGILEEVIAVQPNNIRLTAEKGRLLYQMERRDEARRIWHETLQSHEGNSYAYTAVTNAMLQSGALDEAIEYLHAGRNSLGDSDAFAMELARIYTIKMEFEEAGSEYLRHLSRHPGMLNHITNQFIKMLDHEEAFARIEPVLLTEIEHDGSEYLYRLVLSTMYLNQKMYEACVKTLLAGNSDDHLDKLLKVAKDLSADEAWEQAARLYLHISSHSQNRNMVSESLMELAKTYEKRLVKRENYVSLGGYFPGNRFLELDMVFSEESPEIMDKALDLYDSLRAVLPGSRTASEALFRMSEIQLTLSGDIDRAITGFSTVLENSPGGQLKIRAGQRLVDAWLVKGDTTNAHRALERTINRTDLDVDDPLIIYSRIKLAIHQGDISLLEKELKNLSGAALPSQKIFNDGLEFSVLIEGNGGSQDKILKRYFAAERLIGQHKLSEAIAVLRGIDGPETSIADEARVRAIQLLLVLDRDEEAETLMDNFLDTFIDSPWNAQVLVWRGELEQYRKGNPLAAIPYYETILIEHDNYLNVQDVRQKIREILGEGS